MPALAEPAPEALAPRRSTAAWLQLAPAALLVALAAPIRIWAAVRDQGMFWPDEIFQSLEQAHRFAFGSGLIPWEFEQGARSWLFPGLIGLLWKLAAALGVHDALTLVVVAKLAMVAAGLTGLVVAMRLAQRLAGDWAAILAGGLCAAFPAMVVYGARCMTETVSGPLLAGAALLALEPGVRRARWAGLLAGFSVFFRYQNGLVLVGLLVLLLAQRRKADAIGLVQASALVGLAGGLLDWLTWGRPFHSFLVYLRFNLIENKAAQWGTSPFEYFFLTSWTSTGPMLGLVVLGLAAAWFRARGLVLIVVAYVLAHAFIPHKEFRFLMPILPLALGLAGAGLGHLASLLALPRWTAWALTASIAAMGFPQALDESFGAMGQYTDNANNARRSVWHADEDYNLALLAAGRHDDLCGLAMVGIPPVYTGGFTYLNRDVPMYFFRLGPAEQARANYVEAPTGVALPGGFSELASFGRVSIYRREGGCAPPPPGYRSILP